MRNARQVLSKAQILDAVWDEGFVGDSNIVEIYISYLRKKVDCYDPPLIHTIRRVGYSLREPRPMRLRRRLLVTMIVLVALGLAAVDLITLTSLHSYLYGRVDDQLSCGQPPVDQLRGPGRQPRASPSPRRHRSTHGSARTSTWRSSTRPRHRWSARPVRHRRPVRPRTGTCPPPAGADPSATRTGPTRGDQAYRPRSAR